MFQARGNTDMIATHPQGVNYRLAVVCNLCKSFASMSPQSVLEHHSGCKAKCAKECAEQEGNEKARKLHKKKSKAQEQEKAP